MCKDLNDRKLLYKILIYYLHLNVILYFRRRKGVLVHLERFGGEFLFI